MTERLPGVLYDQLAKSIWDLGRVTIGHLVDIAPIPSRVKGEIELDEEVLEPEFIIIDPTEFHAKLPPVVGLTVNSAEAYSKDAAFTMYTWRKVILNMRQRRREFEQGVTLLDGEGNSITPQLDLPQAGTRRRPGSHAWRELKGSGKLQAFDAQTAQEFIETSNRFREHIVRNNNI